MLSTHTRTEHSEKPPRIRRGTPREDGMVYGSRFVRTNKAGRIVVYHHWVPKEKWLASLKLRHAPREYFFSHMPKGPASICHRVRDAGVSLKRLRPSRWATLWLGCDVEQFRARIESQFLPGMSWDNTGAWHLDHVVPCRLFDWDDPKAPYVCSHYANLQPLWPVDNLRKNCHTDVKTLVKVAEELPHELRPVLITIAEALEIKSRPACLTLRDPEPQPLGDWATISIMYNRRLSSFNFEDLCLPPPPCPTHSDGQNLISALL